MGSQTAGPEAASEGSGQYHPPRRKEPGTRERGGEKDKSALPRGVEEPLTQQQPPRARGAQERDEHPCGEASVPRSAHCGGHCAPHRLGPPRPAHSPSLPRRRAVFSAALLLSPFCQTLQNPPKRGYAAGGARMLVRASLPLRIYERRRVGARERNLLLYSFIFSFSR